MIGTYNRGYTLIEVIVIIAIVGLLSAGVFGLYGILRGADFDSQAQALLSDLREMQTKSKTVESNKEYGVAFTSSSWTTKSRPIGGAATSLRTTNLDGVTLNASLNPSATELYFARLSGKPKNNTNATLTLTLTETGQTKRIQVKDTGVLYVE
jgi:prepilin-type N-terminal cleavage/methylation domain-containing protein